ncbi:peptidyl-tRNA hydrolase [Morchella snyderi]|nr:peptidyl-tRNA hydrolase [Morchella snyderi]
MDRKVLVCSIGNPGAYLTTRHSAGHTITTHLRDTLGHGPFHKSKPHSGDLATHDADPTYTLWQSRSLMNVSGAGVQRAWRTFLAGLDAAERDRAVLVVVHDEMEAALGAVKVKRTGSAGGHNGLVSVIAALGTKDFTRIGVGIGRPVSRDSQVVSDYVLGKFTAGENKLLRDKSLPQVLLRLKEIASAP